MATRREGGGKGNQMVTSAVRGVRSTHSKAFHSHTEVEGYLIFINVFNLIKSFYKEFS